MTTQLSRCCCCCRLGAVPVRPAVCLGLDVSRLRLSLVLVVPCLRLPRLSGLVGVLSAGSGRCPQWSNRRLGSLISLRHPRPVRFPVPGLQQPELPGATTTILRSAQDLAVANRPAGPVSAVPHRDGHATSRPGASRRRSRRRRPGSARGPILAAVQATPRRNPDAVCSPRPHRPAPTVARRFRRSSRLLPPAARFGRAASCTSSHHGQRSTKTRVAPRRRGCPLPHRLRGSRRPKRSRRCSRHHPAMPTYHRGASTRPGAAATRPAPGRTAANLPPRTVPSADARPGIRRTHPRPASA